MRILHVSDEDEVVAISILLRYQDKDFSLTDATSFLCMDRLGIREAFAFDEDFARYGFSLLA